MGRSSRQYRSLAGLKAGYIRQRSKSLFWDEDHIPQPRTYSNSKYLKNTAGMLCKNTLIAVLGAAVVTASPYPHDATSAVPAPTGTLFFGNKGGNFQPSQTIKGVHVDATGGQVTNSNLAVTSIVNDDGVEPGKDAYNFYSGDGTTSAGWPAKSAWISFEDMFNNNKVEMFSSCDQFSESDDSGPEVGAIYNALQQVAMETEVDHRFILAVVMQESGGCVRAPTTNYGVRNPGLMQDHDGAATCNDNGDVQNPCPTSTITQMIRDGSAGTASGDGLAQCINESGASDVSAFYKAARIYNAGSLASNGDLGAPGATRCYSSDIANRLTGWVQAAHGCTLDG